MTKEEEMALLIFCMKRGYEQMRRDPDSPMQNMINEANRLLVGFDFDDLCERYALSGRKPY